LIISHTSVVPFFASSFLCLHFFTFTNHIQWSHHLKKVCSVKR
jgi:hypothetical protein